MKDMNGAVTWRAFLMVLGLTSTILIATLTAIGSMHADSIHRGAVSQDAWSMLLNRLDSIDHNMDNLGAKVDRIIERQTRSGS